MEKRNGFIFYYSFWEAISELPDENQLELYKAISNYSFNFEEPNFSGINKTVWILIKPQLEANNRRYENSKKGGAPKGNKNAGKDWGNTSKQPKDNQDTTKGQPKEKEKENVKEKEKEKEKENVKEKEKEKEKAKEKANNNINNNDEKNNEMALLDINKEKEKSSAKKEKENEIYNVYDFVEDFIDKENGTIKYLINKDKDYIKKQSKYIDKLIKQGYDIETIKTVLRFVKQDNFWKNQILSIEKLLRKNKDGVPYIVVMIEKIKEYKPKYVDLDALYNN